MNTPIQTWSALLIGDTNGILGHVGRSFDGHPEHYERTELVRKSELDQLQSQVSRLEQWKSEQLQLESMWNEQSVGRLLGVRLGEMIRPNIEPKIIELLGRISELERRNKELSSQDGRRFGRMEAAKALLEHDPDDLDDLIGSREVADTGDFASYWITEAVLNLFDVDSESSTLEHLDGENFRLWHEKHELEMDRNRLLLRLKEIRNLNCTDEILNPPMTMCATEAIAIKALNQPPTQ